MLYLCVGINLQNKNIKQKKKQNPTIGYVFFVK